MNSNTITIAGNLVKDPVLKYLPSGKAVINFAVACNRRWQDKSSQEWVEGETTYFKVECWDVLAENISDSLRKGDPVIVVGRMTYRTYEQDGKTREAWELKADTVGPDLRRRAASLRRVLRSSQTAEHPHNLDGPTDDDEDTGVEDLDQPTPAPDLAPDLAVAS